MPLIIKIIEKKKAIKIFIASVIIAIFEMLGLAVIIPYLKLCTNPDLIYHNNYLPEFIAEILQNFGESLIIALSIFVILVFIIKFITTIALNKFRFRQYAEIVRDLSNKLFKLLLSAKYGYLVNNSVAEYTAIINAETIHAVICLESIVSLGTESFFLFLILFVLFIVSPATAGICILLIILISFPLFLIVLKKIDKLGKMQLDVHVKQYKFLYNLINSIKDIKIMRLEDDCYDENAEMNNQYANIIRRYNLYQILPKTIIELLILIGFAIMVMISILFSLNPQQTLPILGFLAVSAVRVIPSYGKIITSFNNYKFYRNSLHAVSNLYFTLQKETTHILSSPSSFKDQIHVEDLSAEYGGTKVLNNICLTIEKGSSIGIVGPSGSGKTTFLDILVGLKESSSGAIYLDNIEIDPYRSDALTQHIGYVPQHVTLIDDTIHFNITFTNDYDTKKIDKICQISKIYDFINSQPDRYETIVGENGVRISGGQKQRIGIARALYKKPEILIFDEATSSLDNLCEKELSTEINRLSGIKTLVIVAHRLTTVEHCDIIYVFDKGRVIDKGTHQSLLKSCSLYSKMAHHENADQ